MTAVQPDAGPTSSAEPVHHERMDGVVAELRAIGRMRPVAAVLEVTPKRVADGTYRAIAASRYRLFGQFDECKFAIAVAERAVPALTS